MHCGSNRSGDHIGFDNLYTQYSEAVLYQIKRIVQDNQIADDLLQEVFVRVWEKRDEWASISSPKSWIIRIGINLALNYLRGRNRKKERVFTEYNHDDEGDYILQKALTDFASPGPATQLERKSEQELIRKLIGELPQDKRMVLELFAQEDYSVQEISDELGIPNGTVKSRLHYGRKTLSGRIREILRD